MWENFKEWWSEKGWEIVKDALGWLCAIGFGFVFPYVAIDRGWPQSAMNTIQMLSSVFLFMAAYWIGHRNEIRKAERRATEKWLPVAEAVLSRLATLKFNVRLMAKKTERNCSTSCVKHPDLLKPEFAVIRTQMEADCSHNADRLNDVSRQLDNAIDDWTRFIAANCQDGECGRIFRNLNSMQQVFEYQLEDMFPSQPPKPPSVPTLP